MKKSKRMSLDGWEITQNTFSNKRLGCEINKRFFIDFTLERKSTWILKQEGYKITSYNSYFEAIQKVDMREQEKALALQKRLQSENESIEFIKS